MIKKYIIINLFIMIFSGNYIAAQIEVAVFANSNSDNTENKIEQNIFYKAGNGLKDYEKSRCFLDLYLPDSQENFPVIVWFHGGSIERGSKDDKSTKRVGTHLSTKGIAMAIVNYRLHPDAKYPAYIQDAAASVAWVKNNIAKYGGNPNAVFVGGHSAGAYLTLMLGLNESYLADFGMGLKDISGLIPLAAQTLTHYTVRKEMGIDNYGDTPIINAAAPGFHARADAPPIIAICGDSDSFGRKVENIYLIELLNKLGHEDAEYLEVKNHNHWDLVRKIPDQGNAVTKTIYNFIIAHI
jgi:acetyl esterase/lipase